MIQFPYPALEEFLRVMDATEVRVWVYCCWLLSENKANYALVLYREMARFFGLRHSSVRRAMEGLIGWGLFECTIKGADGATIGWPQDVARWRLEQEQARA